MVMRAFVTGGTGLLGQALIRALLEQGADVTALVRSRAKAAALLADLPVTLVEGDLREVAGFAPALDGCDVLFHTAAYFREYNQPGDHWAALKALNVDATLALLREAERRGVRRAIYTSSSGVIGAPPAGRLADEETPPDAYTWENLYFKSKLVAEEAIADFLRQSSLPVVLILPGWMYGPADAGPTGAGQLVLDFLNRRLPGLVGAGGQISVVDVRDVAAAMVAAVERGRSGERYIVAGHPTSVPDLLLTLARVSGVPAPAWRVPYPLALAIGWLSEVGSRLTGRPALATVSAVRLIHQRRPTGSSKAIRELGARFRPLQETLHDTVDWYRRHQPERLSARAIAEPYPRAARPSRG
jgi:dihydroflavonol-4-reductase